MVTHDGPPSARSTALAPWPAPPVGLAEVPGLALYSVVGSRCARPLHHCHSSHSGRCRPKPGCTHHTASAPGARCGTGSTVTHRHCSRKCTAYTPKYAHPQLMPRTRRTSTARNRRSSRIGDTQSPTTAYAYPLTRVCKRRRRSKNSPWGGRGAVMDIVWLHTPRYPRRGLLCPLSTHDSATTGASGSPDSLAGSCDSPDKSCPSHTFMHMTYRHACARA